MSTDIIENMKLIEQFQRKNGAVKPTNKEQEVALEVSSRALNQAEVIALTPYGLNMMRHFGFDGIRLLPGQPTTRAERWLTQRTEKLLEKYCGSESLSYDTSLSVWDPKHYNVDCWRNFKRDDAIRHAVPGMNKDRLKAFKQFARPIKDYDLIKLVKHDQAWMNAVQYVISDIPSVKTDRSKFYDVNLPFMSKHTNVGYPYYRNDQATAPNGKTYGQLVMDVAKRKKPRDVIGYPFVAFGRNLRGKARPIFGGSRVQALVFNQLEHQEIEAYKEKSSLFVGYNSDKVLRNVLRTNALWYEAHPDCYCFNRDYAKFDSTVFPSLRRLVAAISMLKAQDNYGKEIALCRGASQLCAYLSNGLDRSLDLCYCRILSGEIDTNRSGGLANAIMDIAAMSYLDKDWLEIAESLKSVKGSPLMVMGDDNLMLQRRSVDNDAFNDIIAKFNMDISHEKGEYGLFFLQHRYFKRDNGNDVYIVPFTRVIRSLYSKEMPKGLGPCGWLLAAYSNLALLLEWPELLVDVAKIFAPFDKISFGAFMTISQIKAGVADEDREAKTRSGKRSRTTAELLYDGDPLKSEFFLPDGSINMDNGSPLNAVHTILTKAAAEDPASFKPYKPKQ